MQMPPPFRPPAIPQSVSSRMIKDTDWMEVKTDVGSCFWHNKRTGESTWIVPKEVKAAMSAPPVPKLDAKRLKMLERAKASGAVIAPKYAALVGAGPKALTYGAKKARNARGEDEPEDVDVTFTEDDINEDIHSGINTDSKQVASSDLKKKDKEDQFRDMLRQHKVHEFSRYEKEVSKFQTDERYLAVPASQRRAIFEEYCTSLGRVHQESKQSRKRQHSSEHASAHKRHEMGVDTNECCSDVSHAEDVFKAVLHERVTRSDIPFSDIPQSDARTQGVDRVRQEELYRLHIKMLRRAEGLKREAEQRGRHVTKETKYRQQEAGAAEALAHFSTLLAETVRDAKLTWSEAWPVLLEDPQGRATNPLLDKGEAEQAFHKRRETLMTSARQDFVEMVKEMAHKRPEDVARMLDQPLETVDHELEELMREDDRYKKLPWEMRRQAWDMARREIADTLRVTDPGNSTVEVVGEGKETEEDKDKDE